MPDTSEFRETWRRMDDLVPVADSGRHYFGDAHLEVWSRPYHGAKKVEIEIGELAWMV